PWTFWTEPPDVEPLPPTLTRSVPCRMTYRLPVVAWTLTVLEPLPGFRAVVSNRLPVLATVKVLPPLPPKTSRRVTPPLAVLGGVHLMAAGASPVIWPSDSVADRPVTSPPSSRKRLVPPGPETDTAPWMFWVVPSRPGPFQPT